MTRRTYRYDRARAYRAQGRRGGLPLWRTPPLGIELRPLYTAYCVSPDGPDHADIATVCLTRNGERVAVFAIDGELEVIDRQDRICGGTLDGYCVRSVSVAGRDGRNWWSDAVLALHILALEDKREARRASRARRAAILLRGG